MPTPVASPVRIGLVLANLTLGLAPSFAFFVWIERNASLPWIPSQWGWPWIDLASYPTYLLCLWNAGLFLVFGAIHSFSAQPRCHTLLSGVLPEQAIRTAYVCVTGLSLIALMGLWQNTGVVLWAIPLRVAAVNILSLALYWTILGAGFLALRSFDPLDFIGLKQIYSVQKKPLATASTALQTSGAYAWVRHPLYALMLLAFVFTPFMTLDRATLVGTLILYLAFAIPLEEKKLRAQFGPAYEAYARRVPALFPLSPRRATK